MVCSVNNDLGRCPAKSVVVVAVRISRDPIEEQGGNNLYAFVSNDPVNHQDYIGLWGYDVHYGKTKKWITSSVKFPDDAAEAIAKADDAVDSGSKGPMPWQDQSYHFNSPWSLGSDSRMKHADKHLEEAKNACIDKLHGNPNVSSDDPETAAKELGTSLHPLQDYYAHGDYGRETGTLHSVHNQFSPQRVSWWGVFGDPGNYPDDPGLDSGGTNGRPAGGALKVSWLGFEYAEYHVGTARITATEQKTKDKLKDFKDHLKKQKTCCACFDYFGIKKP